VWLEYEDRPRFVADAGRATLYNPRQLFRRAKLSPDGDNTDYFEISESLARDVVGHFSPADADAPSVFRFAMAPVSPPVYLAQRALFDDVDRGLDDRLEIEERVVGIITGVIGRAYEAMRKPSESNRRTHELVEQTRETILASLFENLGVSEIANRLDVSPFHLCRVFRASTGTTLHEYRRDMRLRAALGLIPKHRGSLSSLAVSVGFYSHSHFSAAFRRAFGLAPSSRLSVRR
jgi:AraC-like DNA-binding protein